VNNPKPNALESLEFMIDTIANNCTN